MSKQSTVNQRSSDHANMFTSSKTNRAQPSSERTRSTTSTQVKAETRSSVSPVSTPPHMPRSSLVTVLRSCAHSTDMPMARLQAELKTKYADGEWGAKTARRAVVQIKHKAREIIVAATTKAALNGYGVRRGMGRTKKDARNDEEYECECG
ncbi:hypothetical protein B0H17DRAFT_1136411 [Mycena rosella]|uniref:Uncharacterized protein n=1 Tax=Mycena rosella TaxID=1033263 RepID=A0AAD7GBY1_MYCRO|nr:hypothetical protein B0H17DRAFT_1136411 [Mycena rosella]